MTSVVARRITESHSVEEVLRRLSLPAVQAGSERAAAEHRVSVRLHRHEAGLEL